MFSCAPTGTRTRTVNCPRDFKSLASTNSATEAVGYFSNRINSESRKPLLIFERRNFLFCDFRAAI